MDDVDSDDEGEILNLLSVLSSCLKSCQYLGFSKFLGDFELLIRVT